MKKIIELNEDLAMLGLAEAKKKEEFVDIGEGYRVPLTSMKTYIELTKSIKNHTGRTAEELDWRRDSLHQEMAEGAAHEAGLPNDSEEVDVIRMLISDYVVEHFRHLKESLGMATAADINLLKRYRPEIEIELRAPDGRDQLFRNLEKSYLRKHGSPVLDLPDSPSQLLPLVDKAVAGQPLTPIQGDKLKRTAQAVRKYLSAVRAAEKEDEKLPF